MVHWPTDIYTDIFNRLLSKKLHASKSPSLHHLLLLLFYFSLWLSARHSRFPPSHGIITKRVKQFQFSFIGKREEKNETKLDSLSTKCYEINDQVKGFMLRVFSLLLLSVTFPFKAHRQSNKAIKWIIIGIQCENRINISISLQHKVQQSRLTCPRSGIRCTVYA